MGWIKEANKLGAYSRTYKGYRIYFAKNGEAFYAINKSGTKYEGRLGMIMQEIEKEGILNHFQKKYHEKLSWKEC